MRALCAAVLAVYPLAGALQAASLSEMPRPSAHAVPIEAGPQLDGEVLEDPVWLTLEASDSFWQVRPDEGEPASERTEVRVAYTADTLFVGVVCYDSDVARIVVSDSRRDASLDNSDSFRFVLDTFRDEQNGFVFGTNPAGIEYDGQIKNASDGFGSGGGSRFSAGSGSGFNLNWDAVWQVETRVGSFGWSAEFAIPFKTLRYASSPGQSWGVNFQRTIRRRNETAYWAPLDRQYNIFRLNQAGTLDNLSPPPRRNLKISPYLLAEARDDGLPGTETESDSDFGMDVKYSITPALTLDVTYNTDFAQVEVDEQQINLDRFNLFFPEKRPFFLENAGLFTVGAPGQVELFFSRRIGINDDGEAIPILGGVRVSGKVNDRTNVGFLAMQTDLFEGIDSSAPRTNYGVARITRELPNRSNIGALLVTRAGTGSMAADDDENATVAIDGQWGIGEFLTLTGFAAQTDTPGLDGRDHAFRFDSSWSSPEWRWFVNYTEVGEDFNPEVGFLTRSGYRNPSGVLLRRIRPKNLLNLYELRPHISYRGFWDFDGFQETGYLHVDNHWEWANGAEVHTGVNFTLEGVKEPFEIYDGVFVPPGTYEHEEAQLVVRTNAGNPLSFSSTAHIGGFFGGDRLSLVSTLNWRRGETWSSEISWDYNDINLPAGAFETNLGRLRLTYSFSTTLLVQALVQYNDSTQETSTNLRFSWLRKANTGLFVVYNEIDEFGTFARESPNRSLTIKYSHLFDVFR